MPHIVIMLKRKPGMTKEAFKAHYESSHAMIAKKYQSHLIQDYRRNYLDRQLGMDDFFTEGGQDNIRPDTAFDAVTVLSFATDADMQEFLRIGMEHGKEFLEDEYRFLDRERCMHFTAEQEVF